jgi:hypothetical protein
MAEMNLLHIVHEHGGKWEIASLAARCESGPVMQGG